jgi:catechol 2,3-dioxygenase-like lactoylglutathione lyase family enzyme
MSEVGPPRIQGIPFVGLSVRDARRSAEWYQRLLGMRVERENFDSANWPSPWNEILLKDPVSGLEIGLIEHPSNSGEPFSEFNTGLDHFELGVAGLEELQRWRDRLDELEVAHSGIKDGRLIVVRDPDNIQMEFFCPEH